MKTAKFPGIRVAVACGLLTIATTFTANADTQTGYIYVSFLGGSIGKYRLDGSPVKVPLISPANPYALAIYGTNLYVANLYNVGKYSTSGLTINASLVSGFNSATGIAIYGTNLLVVNYSGTGIGEYTTSGATVNASFTPDAGAWAIANSGNELFVANYAYPTNGSIGEIGPITNPSLITGLDGPQGIAVSGTNIFVANYQGNTIGEYSTSGLTINASLISGLKNPVGVAILGTNLFVANLGTGNVGEYTTSGATVNPSFITGSGCIGITINFEPQINIAPAVDNQIAVYYPTWATNCVVQSAGSLSSPNWANMTNGTPMTCVLLTNFPPSSVFRLAPAQ